jgi:hypothetical protein
MGYRICGTVRYSYNKANWFFVFHNITLYLKKINNKSISYYVVKKARSILLLTYLIKRHEQIRAESSARCVSTENEKTFGARFSKIPTYIGGVHLAVTDCPSLDWNRIKSCGVPR